MTDKVTNVMTINVCAATSRAKWEAVRTLLVEKEVSIAMLQEVAIPSIDMPGFKAMVNAGEARRGTAILVREELQLMPIMALPSGRGCAAKVGNLSIVCVYAPAGTRKRQERADFFAVDVAQLLAAAGTRVLLGGDFNAIIEDRDSTGTTLKLRGIEKHAFSKFIPAQPENCSFIL